jgi:large subunit ribosomal protein L24
MIYLATYQTRSKQLGSALSKDLHKKYGKRSIRVVEGDSVKIVRGEYKGVDGKISKVSTQKSTVAIEGIKKEKTKGDKFDVYIHTSIF